MAPFSAGILFLTHRLSCCYRHATVSGCHFRGLILPEISVNPCFYYFSSNDMHTHKNSYMQSNPLFSVSCMFGSILTASLLLLKCFLPFFDSLWTFLIFPAYWIVQLVFTKSLAKAFCFESSRSFALHGSHSWTFWCTQMKHRCGTGSAHLCGVKSASITLMHSTVLLSSKCFSKPKTWLRITWRLLHAHARWNNACYWKNASGLPFLAECKVIA